MTRSNPYKILSVFFVCLLLCSCKASKTVASRQADEVVSFAMQFQNTPYRYGGATPQGFDCSGYVQYVYRKFGYPLPRTASEQMRRGLNVKDQNLKPGDLVFFKGSNLKSRTAGHVGIVVQSRKKGQFLFIHASSRGVRMDDSQQAYYRSRYICAKRIIY